MMTHRPPRTCQGAGLLQFAWVYLAFAMFSMLFLMAATADDPRSPAERIAAYLSSAELERQTRVTADERVKLENFYADRGHAPAWFEGNDLGVDGLYLLRNLANAADEGLEPADYYLDAIEARRQNRADAAELDVLLTLAYTRYATHLRKGRITDAARESFVRVREADFDAFALLRTSVRHRNQFAALYTQSPRHPQYQKLRRLLLEYREIAQRGGWPVMPATHLLKPGTRDPRIQVLRQRLKITGDLDPQAPDSPLYDEAVKQAVAQFQRRHGMLVDGVAGEQTLRSMNVPVEERIRQIILAMERWRKMPRELGDDYILVNAAGFELIGVRNGRQELEMRVVVGQQDWATPMFSTKLTQITVNPVWRVPRTIAAGEILPKQVADPTYLSRNGYRVLRWRNGGYQDLDPAAVNWGRYDEGYFPFELHRRPGRRNPLGKVKFHMPNPYDIYLHDTPNRRVFNQPVRNLSHGCVRVQYPKALARFVLRGDSAWDRRAIDAAFAADQTLDIKLAEALPVHIAYLTAWVDSDGQIHFYRDFYKKDQNLTLALNL